MKSSHDLARLLLSVPDMPVSTHANNHTSAGESFKVGLMQSRHGQSILIGNFSRKHINHPNEYVTEVLSGENVPDNWKRY